MRWRMLHLGGKTKRWSGQMTPCWPMFASKPSPEFIPIEESSIETVAKSINFSVRVRVALRVQTQSCLQIPIYFDIFDHRSQLI